MARASIPTLSVGRDTLEAGAVSLPIDGGYFQPLPNEILRVTNTGIAAQTATVVSPYGHDRVVSLGVGETHLVRVDTALFVQADGTLHVDVSAANDVSALVITPGKVDVG